MKARIICDPNVVSMPDERLKVVLIGLVYFDEDRRKVCPIIVESDSMPEIGQDVEVQVRSGGPEARYIYSGELWGDRDREAKAK